MGLKRIEYRIWLAGEDDDDSDGQVVQVRHADMLLAEQKGAALGYVGGVQSHPMTYATLWVWAALVREQRTAVKFQEFVSDFLLDMRQERDTDVPPTMPDLPSGSPSPSPSVSEGDPPTG